MDAFISSMILSVKNAAPHFVLHWRRRFVHDKRHAWCPPIGRRCSAADLMRVRYQFQRIHSSLFRLGVEMRTCLGLFEHLELVLAFLDNILEDFLPFVELRHQLDDELLFLLYFLLRLNEPLLELLMLFYCEVSGVWGSHAVSLPFGARCLCRLSVSLRLLGSLWPDPLRPVGGSEEAPL